MLAIFLLIAAFINGFLFYDDVVHHSLGVIGVLNGVMFAACLLIAPIAWREDY